MPPGLDGIGAQSFKKDKLSEHRIILSTRIPLMKGSVIRKTKETFKENKYKEGHRHA